MPNMLGAFFRGPREKKLMDATANCLFCDKYCSIQSVRFWGSAVASDR